ncbi:MAG: TonB-dependent receptor, partial [Caulobacterales bacterium]
SFDLANRFEAQGQVEHRGLELSYSGRIGERLSVVAGAVFIDPIVSGESVDMGRTGERAVGVPDARARIDLNYRTNLFGGLTPTFGMSYIGERAASATPYAALGGEQVMLNPVTTFDIGVRNQFRAGGRPVSVRLTIANVTNEIAWRSIASNSYQMDDRRRLILALLTDF